MSEISARLVAASMAATLQVPLVLLTLSVPLTPALAAKEPPFVRTEEREPCAAYDELRRPFFGDLHVHTSFSWDAHIFGNSLNAPADAYAFARGNPRPVPVAGVPQQIQLRRALDFAAVTDHSEYFGQTRICQTKGAPGYDSFHCKTFRGEADPPVGLTAFQHWGLQLTLPFLEDISACDSPGVCDAAAVTVWQETQNAAEAAYDRTEACTFTSFVAYEYTGSTGGNNGHRNVIFRNHNVPAFPTSSFETDGTNAPALWQALQQTCIEGTPGCQVLAIPHNSNISGGTMFTAPATIEEAATRAVFEPLAEIAQIKGSSECRFDRQVGMGAGTEDELCAWENRLPQMQSPVPGVPYVVDIDEYPLSNMLRNALKGGLALDRAIGVNPFRFGFIGSTDTHNGTPGAAEEDEPYGNHGLNDDTLVKRVRGDLIYDTPGALAVLWAEENSRDSLFTAMQRREAYATSGTRPVVRFFGGWKYKDKLCGKKRQVKRGYRKGVPMGSYLPERKGDRSPRFYVSAMKDAGTIERPGTDLQRIQIVKGWVDAAGVTHEQVFDVAGSAALGAGVDPASCAPTGQGFADLCTVWEDPDFDPALHAFYYARVLENPSCRWSTLACKQLGADPFSPTCLSSASALGIENCCLNQANDPFLSPTTQERAWTSPIWYRPAS
ncbi:MAG TPA: DUF3604 domain-containing protein [Candidatus Binatia bacterium]|nr:DUF3604 domain-containing protein [Candidatus Binatia bacterium]